MPKICVLSQNTLKAYATDAITEWSKGVAGTNIKKKKKKKTTGDNRGINAYIGYQKTK